jgi:Zn-finger nucleic acid-binding protein
MPLLMCPNDNASMQTLNRNGVEFDMCPTCRGVWLDRGELEKLMQSARDAFGAEAPQTAAMPPQQAQQRPPQEQYQQQYGERGEYGERGGYDDRGQQGRRRRRGGFDLFDIFD